MAAGVVDHEQAEGDGVVHALANVGGGKDHVPAAVTGSEHLVKH